MSPSWTCSVCGAVHEGIALEWGFTAPAYWDYADRVEGSFLDSDHCVIPRDGDAFDYFVRGVIEIPIVDGATADEDSFGIGAWASLSEPNFRWLMEHGDADGDAQGAPWFGWLSNSIPIYPETLNLKTEVRLRGADWRPSIRPQLSDHPLARDVYGGISLARAHDLSARWHHANDQ